MASGVADSRRRLKMPPLNNGDLIYFNSLRDHRVHPLPGIPTPTGPAHPGNLDIAAGLTGGAQMAPAPGPENPPCRYEFQAPRPPMLGQKRQSPSGGSWAAFAQKAHSSRSCSWIWWPSRFTIRRRILGSAEASKTAFDLAPDIGVARLRGGVLGGSFRHLLLRRCPPLAQQA